jgi:Sel1 repeat-containing protein
VRCPRCGNENHGTNRFCGMCGATLLPASALPAQGAAAQEPAPAPKPSPAPAPAPHASTPVSAEAPVIGGPSFLGLNDPAPSVPRPRASLSIDPRAPSSRNLDYLLEDDDEPKGGAGKWILILVALALAAGFGYLRWKNQGLSWLTASKPSAATAPADAPDANAPAASGGSTASPTPAANPPATSAGSQPAAGSTSSSSAPANTPASVPASPPAASSNTPAANASPVTGTPVTGTPASPATGDTGPSNSAPASATSTPSAGTKDSSDSPSDASTTPAKPRPAAAAAAPQPAAPPRPVRTVDPVTEAQRYIYGKGVRQDCDHGLRLLKPAADQSNTKAMVEMGALYSAGLCTPRDLPTAYRWFALALRKDPDNESVQADLQKLWGEMTQPERQLAIRLSQ